MKHKSGLADSPFFTPSDGHHQSVDQQTVFPAPNHQPVQPNVVSRYHDTIVDLVKQAVKQFGKEAATYRFTLSEKRALAEMVYAYRSRGIKASENEIVRAALNFALRDYQERGEESILDRVMRVLHK